MALYACCDLRCNLSPLCAAHSVVHAHWGHELVPFGASVADPDLPCPSLEAYVGITQCRKHVYSGADGALTYWCKNCNGLCCKLCMGDHTSQGHIIIVVTASLGLDTALSFAHDMSCLVPTTDYLVRLLDNVRRDQLQLTDNYVSSVKKLEISTGRQHALIDEHAATVATQLKVTYDTKAKQLQEDFLTYSRLLDDLRTGRDLIEIGVSAKSTAVDTGALHMLTTLAGKKLMVRVKDFFDSRSWKAKKFVDVTLRLQSTLDVPAVCLGDVVTTAPPARPPWLIGWHLRPTIDWGSPCLTPMVSAVEETWAQTMVNLLKVSEVTAAEDCETRAMFLFAAVEGVMLALQLTEPVDSFQPPRVRNGCSDRFLASDCCLKGAVMASKILLLNSRGLPVLYLDELCWTIAPVLKALNEFVELCDVVDHLFLYLINLASSARAASEMRRCGVAALVQEVAMKHCHCLWVLNTLEDLARKLCLEKELDEVSTYLSDFFDDDLEAAEEAMREDDDKKLAAGAKE